MLTRNLTGYRLRTHVDQLAPLYPHLSHLGLLSQQRRTIKSKVRVPKAIRRDPIATALGEIATEIHGLKVYLNSEIKNLKRKAQVGNTKPEDGETKPEGEDGETSPEEVETVFRIRHCVSACEGNIRRVRDQYLQTIQSETAQQANHALLGDEEIQLMQKHRQFKEIGNALRTLGVFKGEQRIAVAGLIQDGRRVSEFWHVLMDTVRRHVDPKLGDQRASRWEVWDSWRDFIRCMRFSGKAPSESWGLVTPTTFANASIPELTAPDAAIKLEQKETEWGKLTNDSAASLKIDENVKRIEARLETAAKSVQDVENTHKERVQAKRASAGYSYTRLDIRPSKLDQDKEPGVILDPMDFSKEENEQSPNLVVNREHFEGTPAMHTDEQIPNLVKRTFVERTSMPEDHQATPAQRAFNKYGSTQGENEPAFNQDRRSPYHNSRQDYGQKPYLNSRRSNDESRDPPKYNSSYSTGRPALNQGGRSTYHNSRQNSGQKPYLNSRRSNDDSRDPPKYNSSYKTGRPAFNQSRGSPYDSTRGDTDTRQIKDLRTLFRRDEPTNRYSRCPQHNSRGDERKRDFDPTKRTPYKSSREDTHQSHYNTKDFNPTNRSSPYKSSREDTQQARFNKPQFSKDSPTRHGSKSSPSENANPSSTAVPVEGRHGR